MSLKKMLEQFTGLQAAKVVLAHGVQRLLYPDSCFTYAQTGEDRILYTMTNFKNNGFYVDAGCNHPMRCSNTFELYRLGWHGVTVDANPSLIEQFKKYRPRDKSVNAVLSNVEQEVEFVEFEDSLVSSISPKYIEEWGAQTPVKSRRMVKTQRLDSIMRANDVPKRFDLLTVDVEGHDLEVLTSVDFNEYRPRIVVVEMHNFNITSPRESAVYSHLVDNGYKLVNFATSNGFFVDGKE